MYIITSFILLIVILFGLFFTKLLDENWYYQYYSNNFTDKDLFTKLIKLMKK